MSPSRPWKWLVMALISTLAMAGPSFFQRGGGGRLAPGFGCTLLALWLHLGSDRLSALPRAPLAAEQAQHEAGEGADGGEFVERVQRLGCPQSGSRGHRV